MKNTPPFLQTQLDLPLVHRGKVRDIYDHPRGLLLVATDRLSAFDVVFNEGIPCKGCVLTELSLYWAKTLTAASPYHLVTADVGAMGEVVASQGESLRGRTMLVERLEMLPVECVVRDYLVGSAYKDYVATGTVCGQALPKGLSLGESLPEPLFTPATKAEVGAHDENISFEQMCDRVGASVAKEARRRSLEVFTEARARAAQSGLILVDTKMEFGQREDGTLILADEILTPDSSRYWNAGDFERTPKGQTPPSYDKQVVRDYLETLDWNKTPPPPRLPAHVIEQTQARYLSLFRRLTGRALTGV